MLKIFINGEDKDKVKHIIGNDSFFKDFRLAEVEGGFDIDGMKYCTISMTFGCGQFTLIGQQDRALADVIADAFKEVPGIELKGSLLLGDDNYRHFYWMHSEPGKEKVMVDYAIDIDEFGSIVNGANIGKPLSSTWYYSLYGTDYGTEYIYFKTIDELRGAVEMAVSNYDIDEDDKKLGLELMDIYKFISEIMDTSAGDLEDIKKICSEIKKKYEKEDVDEDDISNIITSNLVPMASAIEGMTVYEVWANAVKKKLSKSKFFKLFQIEEELEDLENEDYIALLSQLAEEYEGFSEIECEDFIDLCDEYGITSEIEEDDFEEVKEKLEDMEIPELDDEWI